MQDVIHSNPVSEVEIKFCPKSSGPITEGRNNCHQKSSEGKCNPASHSFLFHRISASRSFCIRFQNLFGSCERGSHVGRVKSMLGQQSRNDVQNQRKQIFGVNRAPSQVKLEVRLIYIEALDQVRHFVIAPNIKIVLGLHGNVSGRGASLGPNRLRNHGRDTLHYRLTDLIQVIIRYQNLQDCTKDMIQQGVSEI